MESPRLILAEDGPARKKLIVKLTEYKGHRLLELRYHFFDSDKQEFSPTKKGIVLTQSNYLSVKKVIEKNHEQVMDWLGVAYVPQSVERNFVEQEKAHKETEYISGKVIFKTKAYDRDPDFFKIEHNGGKTTVIFNENHQFYSMIKELIESGESGKKSIGLLAIILETYSKSKLRLQGSPTSSPEILFEQLEYDWSNYLSNKTG